MANQPGTIDPDYRGEIGVILYNSTPFLTTIEKGESIAQMVASTFHRLPVYQVGIAQIEETERMEGGFGSTNKGEV